jgi:hypothetical protein
MDLSIGYIGGLILNILIFILLILIYTYILKLESIGCKCSEHSNRDFIKSYTIIAIVFLLFTSFISIQDINDNFGETIAILMSIVTLVFYVIFIIYIYMTFEYVRYLINEKCKCSEDLRREIIMVGTMIELILFFIALLTGILIPILTEVIISILSKSKDFKNDLQESIYNPLGSIKKVPAKLSKSAKSVSSFLKKSSADLKKLSKTKSSAKASTKASKRR